MPYEIRYKWYPRKEPTTAVMTNPANPTPSSCNGVLSSCHDVGYQRLSRRHLTYDVHRIGESIVDPRDGHTAHVHGHENDACQKVNEGGICTMSLYERTNKHP